jgi:hypothetical protein
VAKVADDGPGPLGKGSGPARDGRSVFERHRKKTIAAVLLAMCTLLVLLDFLLGAIVPRPEDDRVQVLQAPFHHGLAPMRTSVERWGRLEYRLATNSLGFRDSAPRAVPLRSDAHRVLFLGDSFLEGPGYDYERTLVGIVGRRLSAQGVECLCGAVTSYCPIIYWRKAKHLLEEVGLEVDEVVVFVDVSDVWDSTRYHLDADGDVARRSRFLKRAQEFLRRNTFVLGRIATGLYRKHFVREKEVAADVRIEVPAGEEGFDAAALGLDKLLSLWTVEEGIYQAYGEKGLREATGYMDRLRDLLRARGLPLTVAVYPWPDQIARGDLDSRQVRHWRKWCEGAGAQFVDLFPRFVRKEAAPREWRRFISEHFIEGDVHWSEKGYALAADAFLERFHLAK